MEDIVDGVGAWRPAYTSANTPAMPNCTVASTYSALPSDAVCPLEAAEEEAADRSVFIVRARPAACLAFVSSRT